MSVITLKSLVAVGPNVESAFVPFASSLTVIHGAANTGKSHIVSLINFAFGSSAPPDRIPEQKGYDGVLLGIEFSDGEQYTLCRPLAGGNVALAKGITTEWPLEREVKILSIRHADENSLSKFLLRKLGITARIRIDAKGKARDLSFRDLAHISIIGEGKIQDRTSPVETGQWVTRTSERSAFRYMLTGTDDRTVEEIKRQQPDPVRVQAQVEIIDRQLARISPAVEGMPPLVELRNSLDRAAAGVSSNIAYAERALVGLKEAVEQFAQQKDARDAEAERLAEVEMLIRRFEQLDASYLNDMDRLEAIAEAGVLLSTFQEGVCPVCGSDPDHHSPEKACEASPGNIAVAAQGERSKLDRRRTDLHSAHTALLEERSVLGGSLRRRDAHLIEAQARIDSRAPEVELAKERIEAAVETRTRIEGQIALAERYEELASLKSEIEPDLDLLGDTLSFGALEPSQLHDLVQEIRFLLKRWGFPNADKALFDMKAYDIEISSKPRAANGKGVRAVLHAAFTLAFAKYCVERGLPHPGFVVLDSPLVTYKDPLPEKDQVDHNVLKDRVFDYFATWLPSVQVVLVENVDPPAWVDRLDYTTVFTGTPSHGRQGFYGPSSHDG